MKILQKPEKIPVTDVILHIFFTQNLSPVPDEYHHHIFLRNKPDNLYTFDARIFWLVYYWCILLKLFVSIFFQNFQTCPWKFAKQFSTHFWSLKSIRKQTKKFKKGLQKHEMKNKQERQKVIKGDGKISQTSETNIN